MLKQDQPAKPHPPDSCLIASVGVLPNRHFLIPVTKNRISQMADPVTLFIAVYCRHQSARHRQVLCH